VSSRFARVSAAGRLAVAAPVRTEVMTARRAAVNDLAGVHRLASAWNDYTPLHDSRRQSLEVVV